MIIDNKIVEKYTNELKKIVKEDSEINEREVAGIFQKIRNKIDLDQLFYSNMMFLSITALLELLYQNHIISIDDSVQFTSECEMKINTTNVVLDVIDAKQDYRIIDCAYDFIVNRETNPNETYYQSYDTYDSLVRRQRIIESFGDHHEKSILFLGDDELFCIYYALHSDAKRIAVLDIDPELLKKVEEANEKFHLNIEVYEYNLLKEFPRELFYQFDVFFASGLKDLGGLLVFIYSGLLSLNDSLESSGYFTFYEYNTMDKNCKYMYDLECKLLNEGLVLDHISVCDQAMIPQNVLERIVSRIKQGIYFTEYLTRKEEIIKFLRDENVFSADPLFPLFSVKPIKIARIRRNSVNIKMEKQLNILRKFSKS